MGHWRSWERATLAVWRSRVRIPYAPFLRLIFAVNRQKRAAADWIAKGTNRIKTKDGVTIMALLKQWRDMAYDEKANKGDIQRFWTKYFEIEKGIYEQLLADPDTEVKGTVKELAEKYGQDVMTMTGFLDGINDSLAEPNPIEEMEEDTVVSLKFDKEKLYKNMVDAKADWLYELPQWNEIFTPEKQKELYLEQKKSGTIVKGPKVGRNDPCPCGSGKKYKKCCGKNA